VLISKSCDYTVQHKNNQRQNELILINLKVLNTNMKFIFSNTSGLFNNLHFNLKKAWIFLVDLWGIIGTIARSC